MQTPVSAPFSPARFNISRRRFLQSASACAALAALPALGADALDLVQRKPRRVGLIGAGWYGKSDLWRLVQVAPVEIVSICDPDQRLLAEAVEMARQRQKSGKKPRAYGDYRQMLAAHDLDIVLVGSPDHWHALHTIAALEAGADVYVQKPISADVLEGEAMLAAARRHRRVVQVGTQRKSTPHLIEAKRQIVDAGLLGRIGHVDMCCYFPMRANGNPPVEPVPDFFDYEMWTGPAPLRPYDGLPHVRWWRTFMEYGNGIVGDMCVHMLDTVRWMLGLGWPKRISSAGGIYVQKEGKSNISDTQTATFEYDQFHCVWQHRTWGAPTDPDYPWALFIHGEKGVLKASTLRADFVPVDKNSPPRHFECVYEKEQYPEDVTEKGIELNAAPATRRHLLDFLAAIEQRSRPIADIEEGHISTASCILANLAMQLGRALVYDPRKREVVGDRAATKLLRRPYRQPWKHPLV
ncbi:MAG: Gfo/Idh/MocA family oxidoreductase [Verrucomicrobia bacterium]|jgi:predicted dehydrogenase|nr:Gfo/Idh/MocA family oxidoreductase [Verrucomicrobiota bacterium]OQC24354.1 MAG: 4-carboxy-2-hydroxymuconate-6-semialdehyde dehydrogenase [Verrucomicrobia bacterium ADurb.Bin063]HRY57408.1 Gfo/Idh/MocA family oxidoreductase [Candidatus Paceibacterota bacterium]MBP8015288.1 Gfo/Idh/MocA family oxidoreductase [Verrucomicrobiota bacterium]MDI9372977.1 Gfo/Idh/MocA family oxidoreductase [Verrucomicrobiota bacterium]